MPKRTNPFQRLMYLIRQQLENEAQVTESAEFADRITGARREVDVLVEREIGGKTFLIGIECTANKRRSTVEWVERMWAKHHDLPTDKLILISKSGFTLGAQKKAASQEIEALALEQAHDVDWTKIVNRLEQLYLAPIDIDVLKATIVVRNTGKATPSIDVGSDTIIYDSDGSTLGDLQTISREAVRLADKGDIHRECSRHAVVYFPCQFQLKERCFVRDKAGKQYEVLYVLAEAKAWRTGVIPIGLTHSSLGDTEIAYGEFDNNTYKGAVLVTEHKGEKYKISLDIQVDK